ncbi:MAG: hypothetical protein KF712_03865 [Akkermansiaceae bacterium]|nr:hypothetical protein [Akkermansiaceae bacterium]
MNDDEMWSWCQPCNRENFLVTKNHFFVGSGPNLGNLLFKLALLVRISRMGAMAFKITEVFGYSVEDTSPEALRSRIEKPCPFQTAGTRCTKVSISDPLGVCMFGDSHVGTPVCPVRFIQNNQMFVDVARLAFGRDKKIVIRPELRILRKENGKKAGKVDYIIAAVGSEGRPSDFCALEVQAVYVSGSSYYPLFRDFLATGIPPEQYRGMDWLSSRKRLIYQLNLKVPVFRRWGKKFFVAVDRQFFNALPQMKRVQDIENSEVTWVLYDFKKEGVNTGFGISPPEFYFTEWADVEVALREGVPPRQQEILDDVYSAMIRRRFPLPVFDI